jgi:AraC family transcriptional regulator
MANPTQIYEFSQFGLKCAISTEEIPALTTWKMNLPVHTFILHLSGDIDHLETEMDGKGSFYDPPAPGHLTVVPAGCDYQTFAQGGLIKYAVFHLPEGNKETSPSKVEEIAPCICYLDRRFLKLAGELYRAGASDGMDRLAEEELSIKVVEHIHTQPWKVNSARRSRDGMECPRLSNPQRKLLREFVHDSLEQKIRLVDLSSLAGMTPNQLLVAFREGFGTTPAQYVLEYRLRRARRLLRDSRQDLLTVALRSGFGSHSHFTNAYSRRFGHTPSSFRGRNQSPLE